MVKFSNAKVNLTKNLQSLIIHDENSDNYCEPPVGDAFN